MKNKHKINLKKAVIFLGMAGVGKSSIGAEVSRYFDLSFIDTDRQIESLKKTKLSTLISSIGEDQFQVLEADTVVNNIKSNTIISPGGSFVYAADTIQQCRDQIILIYLHDTAHNIKQRIPNIAERGIIGLKNKSFETLFNERHKLYINACDVQFNINHHGFSKTTNHIIEYLKIQA